MGKKIKKVTAKNLTKIFNVLAKDKFIDKDEFAEKFNEFLDDLLGNDFFGTEGQNDPRGDHRD